MTSIIHIPSVALCVCVCVCVWVHVSSLSYSCPWMENMDAASYSRYFNSPQRRCSLALTHTQTRAQVCDSPYSCPHRVIHHCLPPISCFPDHKLIRPMTASMTETLNNVWSIVLSSILSSAHPSLFFLLCLVPLAPSAVLQAASDPRNTWVSGSRQEALWEWQVRHVLDAQHMSSYCSKSAVAGSFKSSRLVGRRHLLFLS